MATTRKKKAPVVEAVVPTEPVVVKGNHLTVTTHPDGRTELEWDDAVLLKEVQEAILTVQGETNVKVKKTRKSK